MDGDDKRHELAQATPLGRTFEKKLDEAWVGIVKRLGAPAVAVHDYNILVELLEDGGLDHEEATLEAADLADTPGFNSPLVLYRFELEDPMEENDE